jgi:soluble lytic murein transglycosylase-like protein
MKTALLCMTALTCGLGWWGMARADIYMFTAEDGRVYFSNVPVDSRFKLVVAAPPKNAAADHPEAEPATPGLKSGLNRANQRRFRSIVEKAAAANQIEIALLDAVISAESGYNPRAVSRKGAAGLMQLMPETARRYGVVDRLDPIANVNAGARYLKDLLQMFNNDLRLALAAYNAGEKAVISYGNRIPPYRETVNYVPRVMAFYRRSRAGM